MYDSPSGDVRTTGPYLLCNSSRSLGVLPPKYDETIQYGVVAARRGPGYFARGWKYRL